MKTMQTMLEAHPEFIAPKSDPLVIALESLSLCEQVCVSCADACLGEEEIEPLRACIRANLDCAAVCAATARLVVRQTETPSPIVHAQLHACVIACQICGDLCRQHSSHHRHCAVCSAACRDCQEHCDVLLGELSSSGVAGADND